LDGRASGPPSWRSLQGRRRTEARARWSRQKSRCQSGTVVLGDMLARARQLWTAARWELMGISTSWSVRFDRSRVIHTIAHVPGSLDDRHSREEDSAALSRGNDRHPKGRDPRPPARRGSVARATRRAKERDLSAAKGPPKRLPEASDRVDDGTVLSSIKAKPFGRSLTAISLDAACAQRSGNVIGRGEETLLSRTKKRDEDESEEMALDGTDRITETTVTGIGGDASFLLRRLRRAANLPRHRAWPDRTGGSCQDYQTGMHDLLPSSATAKMCQKPAWGHFANVKACRRN
jgi:hypothetical protein